MAHFRAGQHETALQALEEARQQRPDDAEVQCALGMAYHATGRIHLAIDAYSAAIALNGSEPYYYQFRGAAYFDQNQFQKALADFNYAVQEAPYNDAAYWGRGKIHLALNDPNWAIVQFSHALELDPHNPTYYEDRARAYERLGQIANAAADREFAGRLLQGWFRSSLRSD